MGSSEHLQLISIGGVWFDLFPVSGDCSGLRGATQIEPIDLVKAIYIVDLEHVAMFWDDWRNFEAYLLSLILANGKKAGFINRTKMHLARHLAGMMNPGQFWHLPPASTEVRQIVFEAKRLASARAGSDAEPSSCDLLYCICSSDTEISSALRKSGLQLERLSEYVSKRPKS